MFFSSQEALQRCSKCVREQKERFLPSMSLLETCISEKQDMPPSSRDLSHYDQISGQDKWATGKHVTHTTDEGRSQRGHLSNTFRLKMEGRLYKRRSADGAGKRVKSRFRTQQFSEKLSSSPLLQRFAPMWSPSQTSAYVLSDFPSSIDALPLGTKNDPVDESGSSATRLQCRSPSSDLPAHLRVPWNYANTRLGRETISYIACLRKFLASGRPQNIVLGSTRVDVDWLFTQEMADIALPTIHQWIAQVLSTFEFLGVPEKLGLMVLCSRYFQVCLYGSDMTILADRTKWLVTKDPIDHELIPIWMRPTPTQIDIEHEIWIDLVLWYQPQNYRQLRFSNTPQLTRSQA